MNVYVLETMSWYDENTYHVGIYKTKELAIKYAHELFKSELTSEGARTEDFNVDDVEIRKNTTFTKYNVWELHYFHTFDYKCPHTNDDFDVDVDVSAWITEEEVVEE